MSSSRLPGKSLMEIGEYPLIWYVVQRAKATGLPVVVCTSTDASDDLLCYFLSREEISFYRGDLNNVLNRYMRTAEEFNIENIVRVTGDNPLFNFEYLKENIHLFKEYNYVDGIYEGGLIKGTGFEMVKYSELKNIREPDKGHQEHVTLALRQVLTQNPLYVQLGPQEYDIFRDRIYLTCDFYEDLELLRKIFAAFHYRFDISVSEILQYFKVRSEIFEINSELHKIN